MHLWNKSRGMGTFPGQRIEVPLVCVPELSTFSSRMESLGKVCVSDPLSPATPRTLGDQPGRSSAG
jgi:hypothetical protein